MALGKLLTKRFFDGAKTTMPFERTVVPTPPLQQAIAPHNASPASSVDRRFIGRFLLLKRALYQAGVTQLPEFLSLPVGEKLRDRLKGISGERHVTLALASAPSTSESVFGNRLYVTDARKILRAMQMEKVKTKLRNVPECSVPYSEFLRICVEGCENGEQGAEFAKILDESGNVIVLGNAVFLRPEQVAKSIDSLIHQSIAKPNDPRRKELEVMEKKKRMIDDKAKAQVRAELYFGLGLLTVQTIGFTRLTFWELSWDVMEPICFFFASFGFALAYLFFLRTSTEPTFQGFFYHRFKIKQERFMKAQNFDLSRYNELFKVCYPNYPVGVKLETSPPFHHHPGEAHLTDLRALHP